MGEFLIELRNLLREQPGALYLGIAFPAVVVESRVPDAKWSAGVENAIRDFYLSVEREYSDPVSEIKKCIRSVPRSHLEFDPACPNLKPLRAPYLNSQEESEIKKLSRVGRVPYGHALFLLRMWLASYREVSGFQKPKSEKVNRVWTSPPTDFGQLQAWVSNLVVDLGKLGWVFAGREADVPRSKGYYPHDRSASPPCVADRNPGEVGLASAPQTTPEGKENAIISLAAKFATIYIKAQGEQVSAKSVTALLKPVFLDLCKAAAGLSDREAARASTVLGPFVEEHASAFKGVIELRDAIIHLVTNMPSVMYEDPPEFKMAPLEKEEADEVSVVVLPQKKKSSSKATPPAKKQAVPNPAARKQSAKGLPATQKKAPAPEKGGERYSVPLQTVPPPVPTNDKVVEVEGPVAVEKRENPLLECVQGLPLKVKLGITAEELSSIRVAAGLKTTDRVPHFALRAFALDKKRALDDLSKRVLNGKNFGSWSKARTSKDPAAFLIDEWIRLKAQYKGTGLFKNPVTGQERAFRGKFDKILLSRKTLKPEQALKVRLPRLRTKGPARKASAVKGTSVGGKKNPPRGELDDLMKLMTIKLLTSMSKSDR
jgi:hypothetical protein